jgi:multidrug efflux pump subunit AcrA (membrane-fusion protein)
MSETQDMPGIQADTGEVDTSEISFDLGPLIDSDTDSFTVSDMPPTLRPTRRRRGRWFLTAAIIALLIILIAGGVVAYMRFTAPPPVTYTQAAASIGNIVVTTSATGPVAANAVYDMNFSASGTIQKIDVHVGQHVKAGQVLARLNSTSLQDAVNQAQQSLNAAYNSVGSAEQSLGNTENQEGTARTIAYYQEQNALNTCTTEKSPPANCTQLAEEQYYQALDQANSSVDSASNQVTSAEQQVASAQAQLQTAKDNLQDTTLTAPHAGTIVAINGEVGEATGSGSSGSSSSSSAFIELVDTSSLNITAAVNEADIAAVGVGQPATFTVAAYPSQTFRASVSSIDTEGVTTSNVVSYTVNMAVDMQSLNGAHVYPGMTATVNITTAESIGTLLVPAAALSFSTTAIQNGELSRTALRSLTGSAGTGAAASGSRGIVVELVKGKLVPVLVTTGLTNGQYTQILSGLSAGTEVIIGQTGGQTTTTSSSGTTGGGRFGGGNFAFPRTSSGG